MSSNSPSTPNPPNNHFFLWILLLAAFGAPPAAYFSFTSFISQHLSQGISILVSYETAIIIIVILRFVWQDFQLTRTFVNILRSWTVYPPYTKYYRNHLIEIFNRDIVLGLDGPNSTKIEQIFVEPTFMENPFYHDLSNPHVLPQTSQPNKNTIWYYLAPENNHKSLLILGAAGIGKSTLLKYVALTLADRKKFIEFKVSYKLPFFLSLSRFSEDMIRDDAVSLEDAVASTIKERWNTPPAGWIEYQLKKDCLILLDGLDEVADSDVRLKVVDRIDQYTDRFNKNRFVISSRPLIHKDNPLKKTTRLGILPFNKEQIFEFVDKWYQAVPGNHADIKAQELKDRLNEPKSKHKFLDLARSPLLLGLIINVHKSGGRLPENRIELYERILEHYLGVRWRQISIAIQEPHTQELLSMEEKRKMLQKLAYEMMEKGKPEIWPDEAKEILESCLNVMKVSIEPEHFLNSAADTGIWILGQRQGRSYKFAHLSFQAYLAAIYARSNPELLKNHIHDNWWLETIILYCSQTDPTPIIKACLREGENRLTENAENLALALYDEQEVQNNLKDMKLVGIHERFNQAVILAAEDKDIELRHRIANKLLAQRIDALKDNEGWPDEETKSDISYIKCAEYQLFLDLTQSERQPDHWKDTRFPKLQAYEPVLGIRLSDAVAFCNWLTSTSQESKAWYYRLPTPSEAKTISVGAEDQGFWSQDGNTFQFFWGKGKSSALNTTNPGILKSALDKYSNFNQKDKDLFGTTALDLANKISYSNQIFNKSYTIYNDLIDFLSSVNDRISWHQNELKANYNEASKHVDSLRVQINNAAKKRAEFQNELERLEKLRSQHDKNKIRGKEAKKELDDIVVKQNNLLKEKNKLLESIVSLQNRQNRPPQSQRSSSYSIAQRNQLREQRMAELTKNKEDKEQRIQDLEAKADKLKQELQNIEIRESELANSLKNASQIERNASQQLKEVLIKENSLAKQLEKARNVLTQVKQYQLSFESFEQGFNDYYKGLSFFKSHFESIYNNTLFESLTGLLNCDPNLDLGILLNKDYHALENALAGACTSLGEYISKFTNQLINHLRQANTSIIKQEDIDKAEYLTNRFNKLISVSKEHIMRISNILGDSLDNLNKKRSLIRESFLRRIICYTSIIIVNFLSRTGAQQYVLWHDIDINLIGRYSDIFIVFALLEERINGTLPASAGILIVREGY